ncbi:MAG TPA: ATP-binding protein [Anaerolineales bacterium]|nr:ATP-binding protein [Anaerolineales bacterium]HNO30902.1 ATP-binding protein [Anaerolineales bacterium]
MISISSKIQNNVKSFSLIAEKLRWVVIAVVSLMLFWTEVIEFIQLSFLNQPLHILELVIYAILIIGTGLFLELFVRANREYKRVARILEYKHSLSLDLILSDGWDALIQKLVELPAKITEVEEAYLLLSNPVSNTFDTAGHWVKDEKVRPMEVWDPKATCQGCLAKSNNRPGDLHLCDNRNRYYFNGYCLGINNCNLPNTVLKFRVKPGYKLTRDEQEIFNHISDEIAIAILAIQDRKRLSEAQSAQVALAERRMVSAFVHDHLGQNLGYLHMKLDQLERNETISKSEKIRSEVMRLREAANESYEIVRDILQKLQPETIPNLANLLKEHAVRVSRTAHFDLRFENQGDQKTLPPQAQQLVFNIFHEILSNVERHSRASEVVVLIQWRDSELEISVADNGIGFNPDATPKEGHYGLEIMRERVAALRGKIALASSPKVGTAISITAPTV